MVETLYALYEPMLSAKRPEAARTPLKKTNEEEKQPESKWNATKEGEAHIQDKKKQDQGPRSDQAAEDRKRNQSTEIPQATL